MAKYEFNLRTLIVWLFEVFFCNSTISGACRDLHWLKQENNDKYIDEKCIVGSTIFRQNLIENDHMYMKVNFIEFQ